MASELNELKDLEKILQKRILGQNEAIEQISQSIRRSRLGLNDPKRPLGAFMFMGPTGVGKTELVKQLADLVYHDEKALIKIDMSEFSSPHTASRLVGATAGYVGYENGGELTEKVRKQPYSIILFDEVEKAHKELHSLLLQILEDGVVTDGKGRKINFKNTILILTSNVGATRFQKEANSIGFSDSKDDLTVHDHEFDIAKSDVLKDLKQHFSPEFINRLDSIVVFRPLDKDSIKAIIKLHLDDYQARLKEKEITLKIGGSTINALTKKSYNPEMGAREVRRVLQECLENPLVEGLLSGDLSEGEAYSVQYDNKTDKCVFAKVKMAKK